MFAEETELRSICTGEHLPESAPSNKWQQAIVAAFIIVSIIYHHYCHQSFIS